MTAAMDDGAEIFATGAGSMYPRRGYRRRRQNVAGNRRK
jgi:hypothetical protein